MSLSWKSSGFRPIKYQVIIKYQRCLNATNPTGFSVTDTILVGFVTSETNEKWVYRWIQPTILSFMAPKKSIKSHFELKFKVNLKSKALLLIACVACDKWQFEEKPANRI